MVVVVSEPAVADAPVLVLVPVLPDVPVLTDEELPAEVLAARAELVRNEVHSTDAECSRALPMAEERSADAQGPQIEEPERNGSLRVDVTTHGALALPELPTAGSKSDVSAGR